MSNQLEISEEIIAPEAGDGITAPEPEINTPQEMLSSSSLVSAKPAAGSRNRRFKEPKKLIFTINADEAGQQKNGNQLEEEEEAEQANEMELDFKPVDKRLSDYLKLNPTHNWIWHEFGDPPVDNAIRRGFLNERWPQTKTLLMPRSGWQEVRRTFGKARRFSASFIAARLQEWERTRDFVRQLQQSKPIKREDHRFLFHIYRGATMPLPVNAKVTTFLNGPGIIYGIVTSFQPEDSTYLIESMMNGKPEMFRVPDTRVQSSAELVAVPLANLLKSIDPTKDIFKTVTNGNGEGELSEELLLSVVRLNQMVDAKKKALQELAVKIDKVPNTGAEFPVGLVDSLKTSFATLAKINTNVRPQIGILHTYLQEYNNKLDYEEARTRFSLDRYLYSCHQAEMDLLEVTELVATNLASSPNRSLYQDVQTILYLTGELGGPHHDYMMFITDNLIAYMIKTLPPELSGQLEATMNQLKPYRMRLVEEIRQQVGQLQMKEENDDESEEEDLY